MGSLIGLMHFLSTVTCRLGVAECVFIVGGAPRNFLLSAEIKDLDLVLDSIASGKDSEWFAKELQKAIPARTYLATNNYGVAILTIAGEWVLEGHEMKGQIIEIANARKESYGGAEGKNYKPHLVEPATIYEDLRRRDFTCNTLLWRLSDLANGPEGAEVLDLLGTGKGHLAAKELHTPADPDKTFTDDPTRQLRCVKFTAKYDFTIAPEVVESIKRNASKLKLMPWNAVQEILVRDILGGPAPRESLKLMQSLGLAEIIRELLDEEQGFASGVGRALNEAPIHLVLDILDLGWKVKTPVHFLSRAEQLELRAQLGLQPELEAHLVQAIIKPPVNQVRFFTEFAIPLKERGLVSHFARESLLAVPSLSRDHAALDAAVEQKVKVRYLRARP